MSHVCDGRDRACASCQAIARRLTTVRGAMTVDDDLDDIRRARIWTQLEDRLAEGAPARRAWRGWAFGGAAAAAVAAAAVVALWPHRDELHTLTVPVDTVVASQLGPHTAASIVGPAELELLAGAGDATSVRLRRGTLLAEFEGGAGRSLRIETRGAVVEVVGTLFAVEVRGGVTCTSVVHGRVRMTTAARAVFVGAGERHCSSDGDVVRPIADDTRTALLRHSAGRASSDARHEAVQSTSAPAAQPSRPDRAVAQSQPLQAAVGVPQAVDGSPQAADGSPQAVARSPQAAAASPQAAAGSPQAADRAPQATDGSPSTADRAPQAADGSPSTADRSPQAADGSPQADIRSPQADIQSPQAADRSPSAVARAPQAASGMPSTVARAPQAASGMPSTVARAPQAADRAPQAAAGAPSAVTRAPQAAAGAPSTVDRSPRAADGSRSTVTRAPQAAAEAPSAVTRAPQPAAGASSTVDRSPRAADGSPPAVARLPQAASAPPTAVAAPSSPRIATRTPPPGEPPPQAAAPKPTPTPDELYRTAEAALAARDLAAADRALAALVAEYPSSSLIDEALYERARIAYQQRAWGAARGHLTQLAGTSSAQFAEPGHYLRCRIAVETGESTASACLVDYRARFPRSPHDLDALALLVQLAHASQGCRGAAALIDELVQSYPRTTLAAAWRGRCAESR